MSVGEGGAAAMTGGFVVGCGGSARTGVEGNIESTENDGGMNVWRKVYQQGEIEGGLD